MSYYRLCKGSACQGRPHHDCLPGDRSENVTYEYAEVLPLLEFPDDGFLLDCDEEGCGCPPEAERYGTDGEYVVQYFRALSGRQNRPRIRVERD